MKKENKKENVCPLCHNHCPLSKPGCKKGREYVKKAIQDNETQVKEKREGETTETLDKQLFHKLKQCEHMLHHYKSHHRTKGNKRNGDKLSK